MPAILPTEIIEIICRNVDSIRANEKGRLFVNVHEDIKLIYSDVFNNDARMAIKMMPHLTRLRFFNMWKKSLDKSADCENLSYENALLVRLNEIREYQEIASFYY